MRDSVICTFHKHSLGSSGFKSREVRFTRLSENERDVTSLRSEEPLHPIYRYGVVVDPSLPATIDSENQEHADHCGALNSQPEVLTLPAISHRDGTGARAATFRTRPANQ